MNKQTHEHDSNNEETNEQIYSDLQTNESKNTVTDKWTEQRMNHQMNMTELTKQMKEYVNEQQLMNMNEQMNQLTN